MTLSRGREILPLPLAQSEEATASLLPSIEHQLKLMSNMSREEAKGQGHDGRQLLAVFMIDW